MDKFQKQLVQNIGEFGASCLMLVAALFFELTFGLTALFFSVLFLLFTGKPRYVSFSVLLVVFGVVADVVWFRPLGMTSLWYSVLFLGLSMMKKYTRWRFLFFMIFGLASVLLIELSVGRWVEGLGLLSRAVFVLPVAWIVGKIVTYIPSISRNSDVLLRRE